MLLLDCGALLVRLDLRRDQIVLQSLGEVSKKMPSIVPVELGVILLVSDSLC